MSVELTILVVSIHVLAGVFWAGTSFAAVVSGVADRRLITAQIGCAAFTIGSGSLLAITRFTGHLSVTAIVLTIGIVCALIALCLQIVANLRMRRLDQVNLEKGSATGATGHAAAALLAVTVVTMGIARYF